MSAPICANCGRSVEGIDLCECCDEPVLDLEKEGRELRMKVESWLEDWAGEKCPEYIAGCPCCEAWKSLDLVFFCLD